MGGMKLIAFNPPSGSIGSPVSGATEGSVLFAGAAGVLAQNNTAFKWVNADTQLQLTAGGATKTPLYIKLAGSQTADAFQVYASDGVTKLASIDKDGYFNSQDGTGLKVGGGVLATYYSGTNSDRFGLGYNTFIGGGGGSVIFGSGAKTSISQLTGEINMTEQTAPSSPAANTVTIYAEDNGSGKTRLMALFATGAAQQIAIEP